MLKKIALATLVAAFAAPPALGFSRCRLSPQECRLIAEERHRLAVIAAYERSIPSSRRPFDQSMYLIDRQTARLRALVAQLPTSIADELTRLEMCDSAGELEIAGGTPGRKRRDCP
jgi:hypothetical protein